MIKVISFGIKTRVTWRADTEQWMVYSLKYQIAGLGKTFKKAKIDFKEKINDKLTK